MQVVQCNICLLQRGWDGVKLKITLSMSQGEPHALIPAH